MIIGLSWLVAPGVYARLVLNQPRHHAPSNWVNLVELAYRLDGDLNAWLDRIAVHAVPMLTNMAGAVYVVRRNAEGQFGIDSAAAKVVGLTTVSAEQIMGDLQAIVSNVDAAATAHFLRAGPCCSGSEIFRVVQPDVLTGSLADQFGVADFSVVIAAQPESAAVVLAGAQPALSSMSRVTVRRWSKVSAHLSAGYRLMRLCGKRSVEPADNEAVLESSGKVAHADGQAATKDAQSRLRAAAKAIDCARSRARAEPDEALELWRGLAAGRWSLVDQFDSDGRRYIVARKNEPQVQDPRHLSLRKLGLRSRVQLASLYTGSLTNSGIDDCAQEERPH